MLFIERLALHIQGYWNFGFINRDNLLGAYLLYKVTYLLYKVTYNSFCLIMCLIQHRYFRNTSTAQWNLKLPCLSISFLFIFIKILSDIGFSIDPLHSIFLLRLAHRCLLFPSLRSSTAFKQDGNHHFMECGSCYIYQVLAEVPIPPGSLRTKTSTNLETKH